jgi:hypothetical protein
MADITFVNGLIPKRNDNAPDYAICKVSVKKSEFIPFLNTLEGDWANMEIMRSKAGKLYVKMDTFEPDQAEVAKQGIANARQAAKPTEELEDDLPF